MACAFVLLLCDRHARQLISGAEIATAQDFQLQRAPFHLPTSAQTGKRLRVAGAAAELARRQACGQITPGDVVLTATVAVTLPQPVQATVVRTTEGSNASVLIDPSCAWPGQSAAAYPLERMPVGVCAWARQAKLSRWCWRALNPCCTGPE
jgi:hypothetical protein